MSQLTIELIDALLSPATNPNAESQYRSIPIPTRIQSLLTVLQSLHADTNTNTNPNSSTSTSTSTSTSSIQIPRSMLTAVLLRREISSLGSYSVKNVKLNSEWEIVRMLGEMVRPLLDIFEKCYSDSAISGGNAGGNAGVRRQIGFVIAEVCSSLSIMEEGIAVDVMNVVLERVAHGCTIADKSSLSLLSSLAQQSPLSLFKAKGDELLILLQNIISTLSSSTTITNQKRQQQQQQQHKLECIQIMLETMNHISIASDSIYPQSQSLSLTTTNPKERMVRLIQIMTNRETNPKKLSINPNSNAAKIGQLCLPPLLNMIGTIVNSNTTAASTSTSASTSNIEDLIQNIMQTFSQCASTCPSLLASDIKLLTMVCHTLLSIGGNKDLDPMVQLSAFEALVTLCMVPDMRRVLMENASLRNLCLVGNESCSGSGSGIVSGNTSGVVGVCAELIVKGVDDDVDDWATEEVALQDDTQWENDDVAIFAEMILTTFLQNGGGGSQSIPIILSVVESLLKSTEWQYIRAGLTILDACLTSSPHSMAAHIPVAIEAALSFSTHPCVRVQYQAIELIGSLCQAPPMMEVRGDHGKRILQALAQLLSSKCAKIICHACLGIVSFCRGGNGKENSGLPIDDSSYILPYLGDLLNAIATGPLSLDVASNTVVYIRAFASIACLADVAKEDFAPYYDNIIHGLMECVSFGLQRDANGMISASGSTSHETVSLRGSAVEAATIVGQSIGEEDNRFHSEAEKIMNLIVPLLQYYASNEAAPLLIPQDQLLAAAARISTIIGDAYSPYVPSVLPHLLRIAREEADVSITDGNPDSAGQDADFDEDTGLETITVALPGMGVKKLILNTTQIQEKSLAARAVYEHASSMGASFGPYANDCFSAFEPLLQFKYSSEVRATSAQALGPIFDSACEFAVTSHAKQQSAHSLAEMYPKLILTMAKQLYEEDTDDIETLIAFSEALSTICYSNFVNTNETDGSHFAYLSRDEATQFTSDLVKLIGACLSRRSAIISSLGSIYDEDQKAELEDMLTVEEEFLTNLVDSIGYNLKCLKEKFIPVFEECILPAFGQILTIAGTSDPRARFSALCLFCDCVEHCGPEAAARYAPLFSEGVIQGFDDSTNGGDIALKEVAVYSLAQIARHAPRETLSTVIGKIAPQLLSIAKEGESKQKDDIENLTLVENSASALATLTLFQKSPFRQIDAAQKPEILKTFLSNLPLGEDEDEAKFCHRGFCDLVEDGDINISENLEILLSIIGQMADALSEEDAHATQESSSRLAAMLSKIQQNVDGIAVQQAFAKLSPEAQSGINELFGGSS